MRGGGGEDHETGDNSGSVLMLWDSLRQHCISYHDTNNQNTRISGPIRRSGYENRLQDLSLLFGFDCVLLPQ